MHGTMGTVSSCMGIFTPSVAEDLGVPVTAVALYFTIRTLTMAVFQPVAGILFNKIDIRLLIGISVLLSNGGMMLMSQFHHIWGWYICAVINGIGLAFICYLLIPIVLNNWFKTNLSLSIGLATACSGIGGAILSDCRRNRIGYFYDLCPVLTENETGRQGSAASGRGKG